MPSGEQAVARVRNKYASDFVKGERVVALTPGREYPAYAERVIDGDTYELRIDLGFKVAVSIDVRLRNVDCDERGTEAGDAAARYVTGLLRASTETKVGTDGGPEQLRIVTYKTKSGGLDRSFVRYVCDVYMSDGVSLAPHLVEAGYARAVTA